MKQKTGNLWASVGPTDVICVPTNNVILHGRLVMGAGFAAEAARRYQGLDYLFGQRVASEGPDYHLVGAVYAERVLLAFQTKRHFKDPADLDLIVRAAAKLRDYANGTDKIIHLPYPGIGLGRLKVEEVAPVIEAAGLPDNVWLWTK
ncbi:MAG: hypothetical protein SFU83_19515 [Meiothermus sp.]|nr:hypothetical protein [Meiothermus sp.]